jgi:hypothetical protein
MKIRSPLHSTDEWLAWLSRDLPAIASEFSVDVTRLMAFYPFLWSQERDRPDWQKVHRD